jgi:hypothetical protein
MNNDMQAFADAVTDKVRRGRRVQKNNTETKIVPHQYDSLHTWLSEFLYVSSQKTTANTNSYHWNKEGFVHAEPVLRITNRGATNMLVLLIDILADRIVNSDDPQVRNDAQSYYDVTLRFMQNRLAERTRETEEAILDAARKND